MQRIAVRWLAGLGLTASLLLVLAWAGAALLSARYPCWAFSNAAWCGHFCDDDPCACPDRLTRADPWGAGPGCVP